MRTSPAHDPKRRLRRASRFLIGFVIGPVAKGLGANVFWSAPCSGSG
ncbi:MAG: hypothetical protein ACYDHO_01550 [Gaiellaceae bacterium]